jgi:predicted dehydrogenase
LARNIKIGIAGTGSRGLFLLTLLCSLEGVSVTGVCDLYEDRRLAALGTAAAARPGVAVKAYADYRELIKSGIDAVIVATSWDTHIPIAVYAMEEGVIPGIECGGASSLDECRRMVRASETTGVPLMFLENCCFGREEMTVLNMIRQGRFGRIVHAAGGYQHDIRELVASRHGGRQDRFESYMHRCAEIYPSHELGPIMKYLDINRGNRFVSLVSMASPAKGMDAYNGEHAVQGDITTTLIKCARGETVTLTYDTTLPRPYSRGGQVRGTKGIWTEDTASVYFEDTGTHPFSEYTDNPETEHPVWTSYRKEGVKTGHGGMDYLVLREFTDCVKEGRPFYMDVYDAAVLMAVTVLSEQSIASGSRPVAFPDFTDGGWIKNKQQ